jgi:hypothetical protein
VLTPHAEGLPTQVDPSTWRKVWLQLPNKDGSPDMLVMEVLWPQAKLARQNVAPGRPVPIVIEELDLEGIATVTAVEPCPSIASGPGRVIVATITHLSDYVVGLDLDGLDKPIESTREHPFYSLDRNAWVSAGTLQRGERIATASGETTLVELRKKPGKHRVYNLTVEDEHVYLVSEIAVLSHNNYPGEGGGGTPASAPMDWEIPINEGGTINAVGKVGDVEIEIIADMSRSGNTVTLDGLHFNKNAGGQLKSKQLQEFGRDFLRQHGEGSTVLEIKPAARSSGATAGSGILPKPITIKLE